MLQQLPFTPKDVLGLTFILTSADARAAFLEDAHEHGMAEAEARQLWKDAAHLRKGVVVGVSEDIAHDYPEDASMDEDQRSVPLEIGLPLKYITGIDPRGDYEWRQLVALQETLDS